MKLCLIITAGYRTMDRNLKGNSSLFSKNMDVNDYAQSQTKVTEHDFHCSSTLYSHSRVFKPSAISVLYYTY